MIVKRAALIAALAAATTSGSGVAAFAPASAGVALCSARLLAAKPSSSSRGLVGTVDRTKRGNERPSSVLKMTLDDDDDDDDAYDEEEDPLSRGIDSVGWLPSVKGAGTAVAEPAASSGGGSGDESELLPLFPLGGIVYTPNSEHVLNIFEPRYREMYNDILMNGSKRFVVSMSHPTEEGRFAQMGVLFHLDDLKEVSEQTADQIKYICNHRVVGRVKLSRVLNPEAWESRDTYLRVEGTIVDDIDAGIENSEKKKEEAKDEDVPGDVYTALAASSPASLSTEERSLRTSFTSLVDMQHQLEEDVRFTRASASTLAVGSESIGDSSLWTTIRLWQSYTEQRLVARQNEMQREFQDKLLEFLTQEKGVKEEELPSAIGFADLNPDLQKEVTELQKRMSTELKPLVLESTLTMQKILEAEDHVARVNLLRHFIDAERRRLEAKKTLKGMFTGSLSGASADAEAESSSKVMDAVTSADEEDEEDEEDSDSPSRPSSIFTDEPDAFQ